MADNWVGTVRPYVTSCLRGQLLMLIKIIAQTFMKALKSRSSGPLYMTLGCFGRWEVSEEHKLNLSQI